MLPRRLIFCRHIADAAVSPFFIRHADFAYVFIFASMAAAAMAIFSPHTLRYMPLSYAASDIDNIADTPPLRARCHGAHDFAAIITLSH